MKKRYFVPICALFFCMHAAADSHFDEEWEALAANFVNEMPALSPVGATQLGDHRFDGQLDDISALARADRA
ncbi:MAG: DUF885 domain-containing protein, partial [Gammaproteobacteria bacterium]|nr:DUF885 domain-containing protein [Gammaproteobacteria bacterium]